MSGAIKSADPARLVTLGDMAYSAGSAKQPRCTLADGPTPLCAALVAPVVHSSCHARRRAGLIAALSHSDPRTRLLY